MSDDETDDEASESTSSGEAMRWAADEPTAMWDESLLAQEGFDKLVQDRESNPREETGPATTHKVGGAASSTKIEVSATATGSHAAVSGAKKRSKGLSWVLTFGLALGLGVAVYFIVRFLR